MVTRYTIDQRQFERKLSFAFKVVDDLRIPFGLIAKDYFKDNRRIFALKGPGQYQDLGGLSPRSRVRFKGIEVSRRTKAKFQKKQEVGFIYPLLFRRGRLASSLLNPNDTEAIVNIQKKGMELGTDVPYAKHLHYGTKFMPARKVVFISEKGSPIKSGMGDSRSARWGSIISKFVIDKLKEGNK